MLGRMIDFLITYSLGILDDIREKLGGDPEKSLQVKYFTWSRYKDIKKLRKNNIDAREANKNIEEEKIADSLIEEANSYYE